MKKTLLIAAAALAASMITSQAQVYSQNIVGYANVATPNSGSSYLITVPFAVGVSNGANEVFKNSLPDFSSLLLWTGNGYHAYVYDSTDPNGAGPGAPVWYESDDTTPATIPTLPVGKGFFLVPASGNVTNTFAGTVAVSVGTSNVMTLTSGASSLVAPVVPYAGAVTNGNNSSGGANLNNLPDFSSLLFWTGNGYKAIVYDSTDPNGAGPGAPVWYESDDTTPYVNPVTSGNVPTINVGQGFFVIPAATYSWKTGL